MIEEELTANLIGDTEANSVRYPLDEGTEVPRIVKAWFYVGGVYSVTRSESRERYCLAVAEGWRKRAGKAADEPLKYLDMGNPVESTSPFRQMKQMEKNWLEAAEQAARDEAATTTTSSVQGTTHYRISPGW